MPGCPELLTEITRAVGEACDDASLSASDRARSPLFLAIHGDPAIARAPEADQPGLGPEAFTTAVARGSGLAEQGIRCYMSACVAASTAIADATAMIARVRADRVVVAAGTSSTATSSPCSTPAACSLTTARCARSAPGGAGCSWAMASAPSSWSPGNPLGRAWPRRWRGSRAGVAPATRTTRASRTRKATAGARGHGRAAAGRHRAEDLGYINAHGSGTGQSDPAETSALRLALGDAVGTVPVSSTKALHGQALEASGVLELIVTLLAAREGMLPVNAGFLGADDRCRLNLVLDEAQGATPEFAMSLNAAFGGANTALVIGLP